MSQQVQISARQYSWVLAMILTAGGFYILPRDLVAIAGNDAWFSNIVPIFTSLLIVFMLVRLARLFPRKNLFEINIEVLGEVGGRLINTLFIAYMCIILLRSIGTLTNFIDLTILRKTPEEIVVLALVGVLIYYGNLGLEEQVRANDLLFPVFLITAIGLPFLLISQFSAARLEPFLTISLRDFGHASLINVGWYGDVIVLGAFMHAITGAQKVRLALRNGLIISAFLLTMLMFITVQVIGAQFASKLIYPNYVLIQLIKLTETLDRMELFFLTVWIPATILKTVFIYSAILIGLQSFHVKSRMNSFNKPFGMFAIITAMLVLNRSNELYLLSSRGTLLNSIIVQLLLFIIFLISFRKGRVKPRLDEGKKGRYRNWKLRTNILLGVCFVIVLIGLLYAEDFIWIGQICSLLYGLCLILAAITSSYELKQLSE